MRVLVAAPVDRIRLTLEGPVPLAATPEAAPTSELATAVEGQAERLTGEAVEVMGEAVVEAGVVVLANCLLWWK